MDRNFSDIPGKVTAAFEYRGEEHVELLGCSSDLTPSCSPGFAYIYSGPIMFEYSPGGKRLFRLLDNNYFLTCSRF